MRIKIGLAAVLSLSLLGLAGCGGQKPAVADKTIMVAVAASLEPVVKQVAWTYETEHKGVKIQVTSGSSGTLARQAEQGAAFDLFMSAGEKEMQELVDKNLVAKDSVKRFLGNKLVVVAPEGSRVLKSLAELKNPEYKHIAVAEPSSVPAGRYAKQVLEKANLWTELQPKFVYGNNVRTTLTYVATANADAAFVYRSDAISEEKAHMVLEIDDQLHDPIVYPAAVFKDSKNSDLAADFLKTLESPAAKDKFKQAGFQVQP